MKQLINKIFDNMLFIMHSGIEKKYWPIIEEEYKAILENRYNDLDRILNTENYEELYQSLYEAELNEWANYPISIKKSLLISDKALEKIMDISNMAFEFAENRIKQNQYISIEQSNNIIAKLHVLLENTHDNNKSIAKVEIEDAITDLLYASKQSDIMSSRMDYII